MTVRTKEEDIPSSFSPARLFVDDIEEIVRIFKESIETKEMNSRHFSAEELRTRVRFLTKREECDDVQDLPKIAKWFRELRIEVTKGGWAPRTSLVLPMFPHTWLSSGLTEEDAWSAFHKLQPIFKKRRRIWSTFVYSIPGWLRLSLFLAFVWTFPLIRFPMYKLMPHLWADATALFLYGFIMVAIVVGARHTYLRPRRSWDPPPIRHYLKDKIIPVLAGALLGIAGTIISLYLRHRFWP